MRERFFITDNISEPNSICCDPHPRRKLTGRDTDRTCNHEMDFVFKQWFLSHSCVKVKIDTAANGEAILNVYDNYHLPGQQKKKPDKGFWSLKIFPHLRLSAVINMEFKDLILSIIHIWAVPPPLLLTQSSKWVTDWWCHHIRSVFHVFLWPNEKLMALNERTNDRTKKNKPDHQAAIKRRSKHRQPVYV